MEKLRFAPSLVVLLLLTACQTPLPPDKQAKVDQTATAICVSADFAHAVYGICATTPTAPGHDFCVRNLDREKQVFTGVQVACTPPYTLGPDVLAQKVMKAIKDIQALSGGATVGPVSLYQQGLFECWPGVVCHDLVARVSLAP